MNHKLTFEPDSISRKATRYFLWLQLGAIIAVSGLITLQFHSLAWGVSLLTMIISGTLLVWLHWRYQATPLVMEKREMQQRAIHLREKITMVEKSLTEAKQRREHLLRKEQLGLEATLLNQQIYHIQKGLSSHLIKDETISGVGPELKDLLAEAGIMTGLDVSDETISQILGFDAAKREVLMNWRSLLHAQLDATKPGKLPDYQLEYIQKKFNRLHARNDEKELALTNIQQQLNNELDVIGQRLDQLTTITFWSYFSHSLLLRSGDQL